VAYNGFFFPAPVVMESWFGGDLRVTVMQLSSESGLPRLDQPGQIWRQTNADFTRSGQHTAFLSQSASPMHLSRPELQIQADHEAGKTPE
jgi:hypothetical protein